MVELNSSFRILLGVDFVKCDLRDADLAKRIGVATALEVRASGIHYTFAPCVAVCSLFFFFSFYILFQYSFVTMTILVGFSLFRL